MAHLLSAVQARMEISSVLTHTMNVEACPPLAVTVLLAVIVLLPEPEMVKVTDSPGFIPLTVAVTA